MDVFWLTLLAIAAAVVVVWTVGRFVEGARAWRQGELWRQEEFTSSAPPFSPDDEDLRMAQDENPEDEAQSERRGD